MARNALADATSPYLLQHAHNPVDWLPWSAEALARAAAEQKLVLLSIGYAACHWCHVMAHESFENPAIAALMNEHFINIKVDREERPDIDQIYMQALQAMGEQGGWPLTMFLTPEGAPVFGGTYFPPEPRWGRPGFPQILQGLAEGWAQDRERIAQSGAALLRRVLARGEPAVGGALTRADLIAVADRFIGMVDWEDGGLKGAPKFPNPPIFRFLWSEYAGSARHEAGAAVGLLLARMAQGGIWDHLGGGFARYATDGEWLVPHFEKMLYDNALLLDLLALVQAAEPDLLFAARADELVGWLLRDMRAESDAQDDGAVAFAASEDADSEGEEGKFYVWTRREIESVLGKDLVSFEAHYPCPEGGNWEERIILTRATHPEDAATEAQLAGLRARLLAARDQRVRPGRDDKILADWNGLAIAALVRAAAVFERPDWLAAAWSAFRAVQACLGGADGRFGHAFRRGRISAIGLLDDQAAMLRAMVSLYQASGDRALLASVERTLATTEARFGDGRGGFYLVADDAEDLPGGMRPHGGFDGVTPAGAGLMVEVYAALYLLTGTLAHRERAEQIIATMSGERRILSAYPTMLVAARMLEAGGCVVIVGDPARADFHDLHQAALRGFDPALVVLPVGDASGLAPTHPAHGKKPGADGQAAAYLCRAQSCAPPVYRAEDLAALIVQPGGRRNS
ncbi:uncharacterized protein ACOSOMT5_P1648 [Acidiphilium sp. MT5]